MLRYWGVLELSEEGKRLIASIADEWKSLIEDQRTTESDTLDFLKAHAGLVFYSSFNYGFPVAELRLGAEHRVDFMMPED